MADIVSRIYRGFRGVDFRGEEVDLRRSPDALNVWKDYRETDSIRTRPGMKEHYLGGGITYGIFFYRDGLVKHAGKKLTISSYNGSYWGMVELYADMNEAPSQAFIYDDVFYIMDGKNYLRYDGTTQTARVVEGYVPTTSIGRKPNGGGKVYEDVNMLQSRRINSFIADGSSKEFVLDAMNIDTSFEPIVKEDGKFVASNKYTVDYANGKITFTNIVSEPLTPGQDNITVEFSKTVENYRNSILNCTMLQVFDNRVFVSGNPDYPNTVWHCSLNDPTYFSDMDYYQEGADTAKVTGMVAGNNALWVFREPSDANTNVFYHVPTLDDEYGKIYPSAHSSITTGCIGKAINFNDDIVFFSDRGMEGISGDITTEQVIAHRSSLVDRKLLAEEHYKNMILEEWEGYLLVIIGRKVYLADSRTAFTNEDHIEYEWFYWEMEHNITCSRVHEGVLYLGTDQGDVYTLTDKESNIESYWVTPKDKFQNPHKLKTTNKRGCVVEATGTVEVSTKTNDDEEFTEVGLYEDVEDFFVSKIKQKNFKDIQLRFSSNKRFSLESVTLECFVGGYIKRGESATPTVPSGGIVPVGTLDIDKNGVYDVTYYATANVNIPELAEWEGGSY